MDNESMFRLLFERSADAITLLDPQTGAFLDVNDASVRVTGAPENLWGAQGKTNSDIAVILGISESTVKKHLLEVFEKLGVETRSAATLRALEVLGSPAAKK
jgi:PAS domain S-box-containing protein